MTHILHISDTHFGTEQNAVVEALLRHVREQPADLLVLSGDISLLLRKANGLCFASRTSEDFSFYC